MRAITICKCFLAAYAEGSTQTFPGIVLPSRASFRQDARHLSFTCPVGYELHTDQHQEEPVSLMIEGFGKQVGLIDIAKDLDEIGSEIQLWIIIFLLREREVYLLESGNGDPLPLHEVRHLLRVSLLYCFYGGV